MACSIETNKANSNSQETRAMKPTEENFTAAKANEQGMTLSCIVCWEPSHNKGTATLTCGHGACTCCIKSWIERCEQDGHDEATCPQCRQAIDQQTIKSVLGRTYQRVSKTTADNVPVDDFTQTWLAENDAHQCSNCGMWVTREEDEDNMDATACVCGYIYCWTCQEGAEDCQCNHDEFYDHLTDMTLRMADARSFPVASPEHFEDLTEFMEERCAAIYSFDSHQNENIGNDNPAAEAPTSQQEPAEVKEEPSEAFLVPLFEEYTEGDDPREEALFDEPQGAKEVVALAQTTLDRAGGELAVR